MSDHDSYSDCGNTVGKVNGAPYPMPRKVRMQSKSIDRGQIEKSPGMCAAALRLSRVEMKFRGRLRLLERNIFFCWILLRIFKADV